MGWHIGFRVGPIGYLKRIGGRSVGSAPRLSREQRERFAEQPSIKLADALAATAGLGFPLVFVVVLALDGTSLYDVLIGLVAVVLLVGFVIFALLFFHGVYTYENDHDDSWDE